MYDPRIRKDSSDEVPNSKMSSDKGPVQHNVQRVMIDNV